MVEKEWVWGMKVEERGRDGRRMEKKERKEISSGQQHFYATMMSQSLFSHEMRIGPICTICIASLLHNEKRFGLGWREKLQCEK